VGVGARVPASARIYAVGGARGNKVEKVDDGRDGEADDGDARFAVLKGRARLGGLLVDGTVERERHGVLENNSISMSSPSL